ncbi:MAG: 1-acyl-sn-glycerol-3-phosphate acyltransferase [Microbacterium sp. 71-36]|uniref:lysophospholipid acyltransferase family protein n=1 Tax=unclassified Microbacterium TaxID=2609290 RepID=UPI0008683E06|nr:MULTISPECIES: lysophospholipid acyltransferase family protein [unclassified Microbacterium]MBN9210939.1 1-acyl-sn-glycerol-3-phosphate acyltransferase [Microbacterium sp.]ODT38828.1 MAG: acyl-phosphate glycerol 3-phosphate acyltransferase [Microbacterium sp. SCN 71-17]ODU51394.1 MAG: acyl-phosphate glycerol 3-phosphate acyltransferase [Microbacterium sp. SCN 70-10]OJV77176.1 MAG: 1-acyl-sn-glycerol-3-phosphate acyltransferase [Microbacterium sp. 71-36]
MAASPEKSRPSAFWPLAAIIVPLTGLFARIEIRGAENLPKEGAYVLAPNHNSEFDPVIVAVAVWRLGRAPRFMAKESLFRVPVLGAALKATGMVPVPRSSTSANQSMKAAEQIARDGRGVIVYAEGTLTRDPDLWPMRGKTGAVRLALAGDLPLIPMAQWGVQQILPRYGKLRFPRRSHVIVEFGPAMDVADYRATATQPATLTRATDALMARISEMLSGLRGLPAPPERWNPSQHGQNETGRLES